MERLYVRVCIHWTVVKISVCLYLEVPWAHYGEFIRMRRYVRICAKLGVVARNFLRNLSKQEISMIYSYLSRELTLARGRLVNWNSINQPNMWEDNRCILQEERT